MLRNYAVFFAILAFLTVAGCQEKAVLSNALNENQSQVPVSREVNVSPEIAQLQPEVKPVALQDTGGKIEFTKNTHDFGTVDPGASLNCEFTFTNVGEGVLKVDKKIKSTCGCTVPTLQKEEYAPGETGTIKVSFKPGTRPGGIAKSIHVSSNDPHNLDFKLSVKADVIEKIKIEPDSLRLTLRESDVCPPIKITSVDGKEFSVKQFTSTGNYLSAHFDPNYTAKSITLEPVLDLANLNGGAEGSVRIELDHPTVKDVSVRFEVLSEYEFNPRTLLLMDAEPNKGVKRTVWLLNNYKDDFKVENVTSKNGMIKVINQKMTESRFEVDLEITAPEQQESRWFKDILQVKLANGKQMELECRGFYKKS